MEWPLLQVLRSPDLRRVLPGLILSALLANLLAIALPMAILQIMDRVVASQSLETLSILVIGIVVALIIEEVLRSLNVVVTGWIGARFEHGTEMSALDRLMHVPLRLFQREGANVYAERIAAASKVAEFYSGRALLALFDLPFVLVFLILVYVIGGWLVVAPLTLLGIFTVLIGRFGRTLREKIDLRHALDDRRFNFLAEVIANIHSVKTLAMEASMLRRHERLQETNAEMGEALAYSNAMSISLSTLFSQVMVVAVVLVGSWAVIAGKMTPGALAACMMLSVRALQPLRSGLSFWLRYQQFVAARNRLNDVLDMPCVTDLGKPELPLVKDGIELRDVTYHPKADSTLFSGLSLRVAAGQCIVIRGQSGSGKTSLLSLMTGLVAPDSGNVLVDGRPIQEFATDSRHREIAFLPQTGSIVSGTILDNLTTFDHSLREPALAIAKALGLDRAVAGMRQGYETSMGMGAANTLPEGVIQLISIVRAMACDPSVVLFDEANISLDLEGDKLLRDYLATQKGKRTMVLVTHRPSMISLADQVYTLHEGRLVEGVVEPNLTIPAMPENTEKAEILPRPAADDDLVALVHRNFQEETDLSICLLPLLHTMKWDGSPGELAEAMPHLAAHLDIPGLCQVMANLGLNPKHFRSKQGLLDARLLPCLFVPADQAAMVVKEMLPNGHLRVFDGQLGQEIDIAPNDQAGEVYLFRKPESTVELPRAGRNWFGNLLWRIRKHIALAFALTVISSLLALVPPLFVKSIYDSVIPVGNMAMSAYLALGVVMTLGVDWMLRMLKSRVMAHIGGRIEFVLGNSVFERIISLPAASMEGASVSRQVGRIKNLEGLREFFLGPLALLVFELPASLVMVVAIAIINPWVLVVVACFAMAFALLGLLTKPANERSSARASQLSSHRREFLDEALTEMRTIRMIGATGLWSKRLRDISGKAVMASFHDRQLQGRIGSVAQLLGTCTGVLSLAVSALLAIQGEVTGGTLIATMIIVWRLTGPMQNVFLASTSIVQVRSQMRQIENLMRLQTERDSGVRQTVRPGIDGALSFSRVSFRYANDADPALLGVNFLVNAGQVVALSGSNGAGKSTLLKLAVRVYDPQAGTIRLDNIDIRQMTAADLRTRISYMPQNCEIFYGTVAQNLRLNHPAASDAEIRWAVEMAGLTADIQALPEGFDTRISNSQANALPYGFRQRLSLARTILKPAALVLLDEPGTGMDEVGEHALVRCIEWLRGRSTVLLVSNRPSHLRLADNVVHIERGAMVAMGPFEKIKDAVMSGVR